MGLNPLDSILDLGGKLIDKLIPDPKAKAEALLKLKELEQQGELAAMTAQTDINKVEAASSNIFVAGWRPFIGWVCGAGLAVMLVIGPMISWGSTLAGHPLKSPEMPESVLLTLVTSMLGIAGMRSYDKKQALTK